MFDKIAFYRRNFHFCSLSINIIIMYAHMIIYIMYWMDRIGSSESSHLIESFLKCTPLFKMPARERTNKKKTNKQIIKMIHMNIWMWNVRISMACKPKKINKLENTLKYLSFCVVQFFFSLFPTDIKFSNWKRAYTKQAIQYTEYKPWK